MGTTEIEVFLIHLAEKRHVTATTQRQALCALHSAYRNVLNIDLPAKFMFSEPKSPAMFRPS
jgi:hypothetical protein